MRTPETCFALAGSCAGTGQAETTRSGNRLRSTTPEGDRQSWGKPQLPSFSHTVLASLDILGPVENIVEVKIRMAYRM